MKFPEEQRKRSERKPSGRKRIQIEYDSDFDLDIDENDDFFQPKERGVYRVYENRSRKTAERGGGGKRISIISITSDDDADAARLRHIQQRQQQREAQNQQDLDNAGSGGFSPTTIQLGEARPTSPPNEQHPQSDTYSYKLMSAESPEPIAVSPESTDVPPLVTQIIL